MIPVLVRDIELPLGRGAPALARRTLEDALVGWSSRVVEDALLAVSEVVTNAVLHAGGADRMRVKIDVDAGLLRIEVHDHDDRRPRRRVADHGSPGGRGLPILDVICRRHGASLVGHGKVVWVEISLSEGGARSDR